MRNYFPVHRKSYMETGKIYFWTATINKWQRLLQQDNYKDIIIESLQFLVSKRKIDVFAFVVMPNHIHLIWRTKAVNANESASGSLLKYTAHEFKKKLRNEAQFILGNYAVKASNKNYEFWQRDPLAVELYTESVAYQKLNYIHANPVSKHWDLANEPCDYYYSTAEFYEVGIKNFMFIKDLREEFS